ncbi:MAG TPA: hypothetical protein VG963_18980 [Polyangiaceae bacterium]|nr:hypothetical protein [Polyangiaceae bacterium]
MARNAPNCIVLGEPQVLVLVGGTVDPGNLWADENASGETTHSRGHSQPGELGVEPYWHKAQRELRDAHDKNWYWEDNDRLRAAIGELQARHPNLHVFTAHGWSGDNSPRNREIAGRYLCDRLCGGGGEKAYYESWLKRPVGIHLLGHSHGGNVINEFTKRAAESSAWPAKWKVRSITYLSTPFFKTLHQVNTERFDPDCAILNVFNKYDLTQRVIADFSLLQLNGALTLIGIPEIAAKCREMHFDVRWFDALKQVVLVDRDPSLFGVDPTLLMAPGPAQEMYRGVAELLDRADEVVGLALDAVARFERGIVYPLAQQMVERGCRGRRILSAPLASALRKELAQVRAGLEPTRHAMRARLAKGVFPITGLFDDLHLNAFLVPVARLLDVDADTLEGRLCRLIYDVLIEQIDVFDNTEASPARQLTGTPFESHILQFDVTEQDRYGTVDETKPYAQHFDSFISHLEVTERSYEHTKAYRDLMEIVFSLVAQHEFAPEFVQKLEPYLAQLLDEDILPWRTRIRKWVSDPRVHVFIDAVLKLVHMLQAYIDIIRTRHVGLVVPIAVVSPEPGDPPYGDLDYLMRKAHSVSRRELYEEPNVRGALSDQFLRRRR